MRKLSVVFFALLLGGCAMAPVSERFGIVPSGDKEQLLEAVTVRQLPPLEKSNGYAVPIPSEWGARELACRTFPDVEGKSVRICRRASRAISDGRRVSAVIFDREWFVSSEREVRAVIILSADGEKRIIARGSGIRELSREETEGAYQKIARVMPFLSQPIGGVRLHFGGDALAAASVPSLTTFEERAALCGLMSLSTSEIAGVASGNPMAAAGKLWSLGCATFKHPRLLVSETKEGEPSKGVRQ